MSPLAQRTSALAALVLSLSVVACGPGDHVDVTTTRTVPRAEERVFVGATSAQRFGGAPAPTAEPEAPPLAWEDPQGWEPLPASGLRIAAWRPAGVPEAECTLILMKGDSGGLVANVTRWRSQMGLPPISAEEAQALERRPLLGAEGVWIDLDGAYSGMGDEAQAGAKMLGLMWLDPTASVFLKLTGPADVVEAERAAFEGLCASLRFRSAGDGHSADDGHDHGGDSALELPAGWVDVGPDGMRIVNTRVGDCQAYLISLGAAGGGERANLDRWRREVGLPPITDAELAALGRVTMMGYEGPLLDVRGAYQGMGGEGGEDWGLLGAMAIGTDVSYFAKMVGPQDQVAAQREAFVAFVEGLEVQR